MAENNIFVYRLFLSLNISDFSFKNSNPLKKNTPFRSNPPLKIEVLVNSHFLKIW